MWHMMSQPDEAGHASSPLPQRAGEPDCLYYVRTGVCDYGISCRFNHPPERMLEVTSGSGKDDYPERVGEPECQFYLKTGTCKFGSTCKYHHPREKAAILGKASVNNAGYPLRQGEKDCSYYMQTGTCKFGATCKFNHPRSTSLSTLVALTGSGALSVPSYPRAPYMLGLPPQSSYYTPLLVPPEGLVPMPASWTDYQSQIRPVVPVSPLDTKQQTFGSTAMYGAVVSPNIHVSYSPYMAGSPPTGFVHSITLFPERPGQPECKFYIKTGDCKFGTSCRYDHPKRRILSLPDCILSPSGFPLRPGIQQCAFYMQYGTCKFGTACRFDHPMSSLTYSPLTKSLVNCHLIPYPQRYPFPRYLHSSVDTLSVNVQQSHEDNETALANGKASTKEALDTEELGNSLNGADSEASTEVDCVVG